MTPLTPAVPQSFQVNSQFHLQVIQPFQLYSIPPLLRSRNDAGQCCGENRDFAWGFKSARDLGIPDIISYLKQGDGTTYYDVGSRYLTRRRSKESNALPDTNNRSEDFSRLGRSSFFLVASKASNILISRIPNAISENSYLCMYDYGFGFINIDITVDVLASNCASATPIIMWIKEYLSPRQNILSFIEKNVSANNFFNDKIKNYFEKLPRPPYIGGMHVRNTYSTDGNLFFEESATEDGLHLTEKDVSEIAHLWCGKCDIAPVSEEHGITHVAHSITGSVVFVNRTWNGLQMFANEASEKGWFKKIEVNRLHGLFGFSGMINGAVLDLTHQIQALQVGEFADLKETVKQLENKLTIASRLQRIANALVYECNPAAACSDEFENDLYGRGWTSWGGKTYSSFLEKSANQLANYLSQNLELQKKRRDSERSIILFMIACITLLSTVIAIIGFYDFAFDCSISEHMIETTKNLSCTSLFDKTWISLLGYVPILAIGAAILIFRRRGGKKGNARNSRV